MVGGDVQRDWLQTAVSVSQTLAGALLDADPDDAETVVTQVARRFTAAPDPLHNLVLAALLLNVSTRVSEHVHRFVNNGAACPCRSDASIPVGLVTEWMRRDAREGFADWTREFFRMFNAAHPRSAARRAARALRVDPARAWTVSTLASVVGTPARLLTREFKIEYGVSVKTYEHLARLSHVLSELRSPETKLTAVAGEAGYRSRKDLYRAMQALIRLTPHRYRDLHPDEQQRIIRAVRRQLHPMSGREQV